MSDDSGRPTWHPTAPHGWLSDPNGPIFRDGRWHVFYQHNPAAPRWGLMHWGHLISDDLVRWRDEGIALRPMPATADADGCWSGCIREVDGEEAVAFYTGATGTGDAHAQTVLRAAAEPGLAGFRRDPDGPVLAPDPVSAGTLHQRDPFLLRDDDGWIMLLATGIPGRGGAVVAWRSADTRAWTYAGEVFSLPRGDRDIDTGPVWECPQLVRLGDDWLLIVSVQLPGHPDPLCPYALWFVGDFDGVRFSERSWGVVDGGDVFYAPAVAPAPDGRQLLWAWLQESIETRSAPTRSWAGALSLPRELAIENGLLVTRPARELEAVWAGDAIVREGVVVASAPVSLGRPSRPEFRLVVECAREDDGFSIELGADGRGRVVRVELHGADADRSVAVVLESADGGTTSLGHAPVRGPAARLEIVVDHSIVEVFCGAGAVTARIDPVLTADLSVVPRGGSAHVDLVLTAAAGVRLDSPAGRPHH